eukprot:TRINITY_DN5749_c0_g1_i2.p1 TRINITY_DN5749_c0_g1~~TRINITY_DN5749_c0_g1_i2.p1  ORF type:complete len:239 (-),score=58.17 TRINITY_DN5749_c0_g1_i2:145-861(-)
MLSRSLRSLIAWVCLLKAAAGVTDGSNSSGAQPRAGNCSTSGGNESSAACDWRLGSESSEPGTSGGASSSSALVTSLVAVGLGLLVVAAVAVLIVGRRRRPRAAAVAPAADSTPPAPAAAACSSLLLEPPGAVEAFAEYRKCTVCERPFEVKPNVAFAMCTSCGHVVQLRVAAAVQVAAAVERPERAADGARPAQPQQRAALPTEPACQAANSTATCLQPPPSDGHAWRLASYSNDGE